MLNGLRLGHVHDTTRFEKRIDTRYVALLNVADLWFIIYAIRLP